MKLPSRIVVVAFCFSVGFAVFYTMNSFSNVTFKDSEEEQEFNRKGYLQPQTTRSGDPLFQVERFILILITSAPYNTDNRQAIRQTWLSLLANNSVALGRSNVRRMKDPTNASVSLVIHYWFVCGHDKRYKVEHALDNETRVYGDILRLGYKEKYSLLTYKTLSSLGFASTMDVKFVVKVDDDVYLHVPRLIWWLKTASLPKKLYAGHPLEHSVVIRATHHKWYVSKQYFNETYFPPYCNGPFYILSKNVVVQLLKASSGVRLTSFPLEDVFIGILAKRRRIKPFNVIGKGVLLKPDLPRAWPEKRWENYRLNQFFALGHGFSAQQLFAIHERFLNLPLIMPLEF